MQTCKFLKLKNVMRIEGLLITTSVNIRRTRAHFTIINNPCHTQPGQTSPPQHSINKKTDSL